jgi:hypothetical protein
MLFSIKGQAVAFEMLDIQKPSFDPGSAKIGEATPHWQRTFNVALNLVNAYKAMKANASSVFFSEHLLTKEPSHHHQVPQFYTSSDNSSTPELAVILRAEPYRHV